MKVTTKVKIVNDSGNQLPTYATEHSAGMDLRAFLDAPVILKPMERKLIPTGIKISLEEGYEAQIRSRSGLALKKGIIVLNEPGTIDPDFTGEVGVILANFGTEDFVVNNGDRIAQMVINKYEKAELIEVEELEQTERGEGGFGHTGIN